MSGWNPLAAWARAVGGNAERMYCGDPNVHAPHSGGGGYRDWLASTMSIFSRASSGAAPPAASSFTAAPQEKPSGGGIKPG